MEDNPVDATGAGATADPEGNITFFGDLETPPQQEGMGVPTFTEGQMEVIQAALRAAVTAQPEVFASLIADLLTAAPASSPVSHVSTGPSDSSAGASAMLRGVPDITVDPLAPPTPPLDTRRMSKFFQKLADINGRAEKYRPKHLQELIQPPPMEERKSWQLNSLSLPAFFAWHNSILDKRVQYPTMTIYYHQYIKYGLLEELYTAVQMVAHIYPAAETLLNTYEGNGILSITDKDFLQMYWYAKVPQSRREFAELYQSTVYFRPLSNGLKYDLSSLPILLSHLAEYLRRGLIFHQFFTMGIRPPMDESSLSFLPYWTNKKDGYIKLILDAIPFEFGEALWTTVDQKEAKKRC
jgi:hypothetical protein